MKREACQERQTKKKVCQEIETESSNSKQSDNDRPRELADMTEKEGRCMKE